MMNAGTERQDRETGWLLEDSTTEYEQLAPAASSRLIAADQLDSSFFEYMLSPDAVAVAAPLLAEEVDLVSRFAQGAARLSTVVGIGDAVQLYRDLAVRLNANYVCVDPRLRPERTVSARSRRTPALLLSKEFGGLDRREVPVGPTMWIFPFNVYPYLSTASEDLVSVCRDGDVVSITTWSRSPEALDLQRRYDHALARLRGVSANAVVRRSVVVEMPCFGHFDTIHGRLLDLHTFRVGDRGGAM